MYRSARSPFKAEERVRFPSGLLIARAKERLDELDFYPRPVRTEGVRLIHVPRLFRIPGMRRFRGYAVGPWILLRDPPSEASLELVIHELCHVWQFQHRPIRMWLAYLRPATFSSDRRRYRAIRYEREARIAAGQSVA